MTTIQAKEITPAKRLRFLGWKKKSQAKLLRDMEVGDIIRIEFPFELDNNRHGYAAQIRITNETQDTTTVKYASTTYGILLECELEAADYDI